MPLPKEVQQDIAEGQRVDAERERIRLEKLARVQTSVRAKPGGSPPAARAGTGVTTGRSTAVRTAAIPRRAPRSGLEVTQPAENQFLSGPNVTGVNELEDL
jgi:hypothetical protein